MILKSLGFQTTCEVTDGAIHLIAQRYLNWVHSKPLSIILLIFLPHYGIISKPHIHIFHPFSVKSPSKPCFVIIGFQSCHFSISVAPTLPQNVSFHSLEYYSNIVLFKNQCTEIQLIFQEIYLFKECYSIIQKLSTQPCS